VSKSNGAYELVLADGTEPSASMGAIISALPAARIELNRPTLEDVFIRIVTEGAEVATDDVARLRAALRDEGSAGGDA
jgi:hypothetical protein